MPTSPFLHPGAFLSILRNPQRSFHPNPSRSRMTSIDVVVVGGPVARLLSLTMVQQERGRTTSPVTSQGHLIDPSTALLDLSSSIYKRETKILTGLDWDSSFSRYRKTRPVGRPFGKVSNMQSIQLPSSSLSWARVIKFLALPATSATYTGP